MSKELAELKRLEEQRRVLEDRLGQDPVTHELKAVHAALGTAPVEYDFPEWRKRERELQELGVQLPSKYEKN